MSRPSRWKRVQLWDNGNQSWRRSARRGYWVSSCGQVRSVKRGAILHTFEGGGGFPFVRLWKDKRVVNVRVNVLVAEVFLGPSPAGATIVHRDGDLLNCLYKNLSYEVANGEQGKLGVSKGEGVGRVGEPAAGAVGPAGVVEGGT